MSDELGNYYITTYGSQLRVAFVPEVSELMPDATDLWQIRAREGWPPRDVWSASFSDETPPEIIAGVTAELDAAISADAGRELYLDRGIAVDDDPASVWRTFETAGWDVTPSGFTARAVSPDGLVHLAYHDPRKVGRTAAWGAVIEEPDGGWLWEARFHSATPTRVIRAFAAALTDPTPVSREATMVPAACRDYAAFPRRQGAVAPAVPTPLEVFRHRRPRPASLGAVSIPRWSTTTRRQGQGSALPQPAAAPPARHR
jgi:hypothetical protein